MVVAGCGGGDSGSNGSGGGNPTLTKAEFIKTADAKCDKGNSKQSTAVKAYSEEKHPKAGGRTPEEQLFLAVVLPNIRANVEKLGEMETPSGDEEKVHAIVEADEKAVEKTEEDLGGILASGNSTSAFAEGTKLSMEYGFKVCGQY